MQNAIKVIDTDMFLGNIDEAELRRQEPVNQCYLDMPSAGLRQLHTILRNVAISPNRIFDFDDVYILSGHFDQEAQPFLLDPLLDIREHLFFTQVLNPNLENPEAQHLLERRATYLLLQRPVVPIYGILPASSSQARISYKRFCFFVSLTQEQVQ